MFWRDLVDYTSSVFTIPWKLPGIGEVALPKKGSTVVDFLFGVELDYVLSSEICGDSILRVIFSFILPSYVT